MVDDLEISKRVQMAALAPAQSSHANAYAGGGGGGISIADAIQLSDTAKNIVKQMLEGQTVAEAWLANKTAAPAIGEVQHMSDSGASSNGTDQQSLKNAYDFMMADIAWLFDAMGTKVNQGIIAELIANQAASNGIGVRPPVSQVVAQAAQSGGVAALFIENLTVTIQRDKVVDASVDRVALTTVHETMRARFADSERPLVLDVGGQFQQVAADALGNAGTVAITPKARPERLSDLQDPLANGAIRPEDPRHSLLIIREGGRLHPEGTLRVKLDALLPIR